MVLHQKCLFPALVCLSLLFSVYLKNRPKFQGGALHTCLSVLLTQTISVDNEYLTCQKLICKMELKAVVFTGLCVISREQT